MRRQIKRQGGFTLIELITVIIILGILAAVVAPRYFQMADEAQTAALNGALSEGIARFNMGYAQYVLDESKAPETLGDLEDAAYIGASLASVDIGDFTLTYAPTTATPGDEITITATDVDGNTETATFDFPE